MSWVGRVSRSFIHSARDLEAIRMLSTLKIKKFPPTIKSLHFWLQLLPRIFVRYLSHSMEARARQDLLFVPGFEVIKYVIQ